MGPRCIFIGHVQEEARSSPPHAHFSLFSAQIVQKERNSDFFYSTITREQKAKAADTWKMQT